MARRLVDIDIEITSSSHLGMCILEFPLLKLLSLTQHVVSLSNLVFYSSLSMSLWKSSRGCDLDAKRFGSLERRFLHLCLGQEGYLHLGDCNLRSSPFLCHR